MYSRPSYQYINLRDWHANTKTQPKRSLSLLTKLLRGRTFAWLTVLYYVVSACTDSQYTYSQALWKVYSPKFPHKYTKWSIARRDQTQEYAMTWNNSWLTDWLRNKSCNHHYLIVCLSPTCFGIEADLLQKRSQFCLALLKSLLWPLNSRIIHFVDQNNQVPHTGCLRQHRMLSITTILGSYYKVSLFITWVFTLFDHLAQIQFQILLF